MINAMPVFSVCYVGFPKVNHVNFTNIYILSDHSLIEFGISNIVYQAEINANGFYLTTYTLMNIYCSLTNQKQMVDNSQQMTYPNYTLQRTVKAMNGVD